MIEENVETVLRLTYRLVESLKDARENHDMISISALEQRLSPILEQEVIPELARALDFLESRR